MKLNVGQNYFNSTCLYLIYIYLVSYTTTQIPPCCTKSLKLLYFVWFACLFCLCLCLFDFWVRFLLSLASLEHTTYKAQVGLHFWQPSCLSLLKCLDYKCVPVQSTLTFFKKMIQNKLNLSFWEHTLKNSSSVVYIFQCKLVLMI